MKAERVGPAGRGGAYSEVPAAVRSPGGRTSRVSGGREATRRDGRPRGDRRRSLEPPPPIVGPYCARQGPWERPLLCKPGARTSASQTPVVACPKRAMTSAPEPPSRPAPGRQRGASLAAVATRENALPAGCQARGFPPARHGEAIRVVENPLRFGRRARSQRNPRGGCQVRVFSLWSTSNSRARVIWARS